MDCRYFPFRRAVLPSRSRLAAGLLAGVAFVASVPFAFSQVRSVVAGFGEEAGYILRLSADASRQDRVEADLQAARAAFLPTVTMGGEWVFDGSRTYHPGSAVDRRSGAVAEKDASIAALEASLVLFDGSRRLNLMRSARSLVEAGAATTLDERQRLYLAAADVTLALIRDRAILRRSQEALARQRRTLQVARERLVDQTATRSDVALAAAQADEAAATLAAARGNVEASEIAFEKLFGTRPPAALSLAVPAARLPATGEEAAARAERGSPTIEIARNLVEAAEFRADAARGALFPTVELLGRASSTFDSSPLLDQVDNYAGLVRVRFPLFDPTLRPAIRSARAEASETRYRAAEQRLDVQAIARSSVAAYRASRSRRADLDRQVANAREAVRSMDIERELGMRLLTDVLDAQFDLTRAEIFADQTSYERDRAAFALLATMGELRKSDVPLLPAETASSALF